MSRKKPKILIVGPRPPAVGGIATLISDLLNSDLNKRFDLISFTTSRPINKEKIPNAQNYRTIFHISIKYLLKSLIVTIYHLLTFPITITKNRPDLVHIHTPSYWGFLENSYYILTSKLCRKKVLLHVHGGAFDKYYYNSSHVAKYYIRFIMRIPNKIIGLSEYWKNFFATVINIADDSIVVVHNGVIFSKYNLEENLKNTSHNNIEILFIGCDDAKRKGAYEIIDSIPFIVNYCSNVKFTFIGKGEIENLEKACDKLDIKKYVKFTGQINNEEKIRIFNNSDIFLLPSHAEGLPISILEAMASGLPIISTRVGSIPEVVENEINGYVIEPGNHELLAAKILQLIQNEDLRLRMKNNNIQKIKDEYDIAIIVKTIENIYIETLNATSVTPNK